MLENAVRLRRTPLSILDLVPVLEGGTASDGLRRSLDLVQHAQRWGYRRYWVAEHHGMPGIASSATAVVIGHLAAGTSTIRVGSGGIMLPNHAPMVIAEQFGTLESLFPGRIDLGLGRAPGTDRATMRALRRGPLLAGDEFPDLLSELQGYFRPDGADADEERVRAYPAAGLSVPIWLLGSSDFSARLAGEQGLPFAFASHFSPQYTLPALAIYRETFVPSEALEKPYAMLGVNVVIADTDEEAQRLATSLLQQFLGIVRGRPMRLQPPVAVKDMEMRMTPQESALWRQRQGTTFVGTKESVAEALEQFVAATGPDELIVNSAIYDHSARLHSYEQLAALGNMQAAR
ncbi:MAG: LLM class flavin-dependent oxidoreductase [Firmicutes bacterium]|nr:LLM class flavin-dependent oxidoreductase [Bacillota bacterium]